MSRIWLVRAAVGRRGSEFDWSGLLEDAEIANLIGQGCRGRRGRSNIDPDTLCELDYLFTYMRHSITCAFGRVRWVVIGVYVAEKNLDWYLGHKYAHNAHNTIANADCGKLTLKGNDHCEVRPTFSLRFSLRFSPKWMPIWMPKVCQYLILWIDLVTKHSKKSALLYISKNIIWPPSSKTS